MVYGRFIRRPPVQDDNFWVVPRVVVLYRFDCNNKKIKKNTWRYHYLYLCANNLHDMIYSSWDMEYDRLKMVIMGHFLPFYPLKNPKNQNFEKTNLDMSVFYTYVPKITIIWCMLPEIWNTTDIIFCHFGPFFALIPY